MSKKQYQKKETDKPKKNKVDAIISISKMVVALSALVVAISPVLFIAASAAASFAPIIFPVAIGAIVGAGIGYGMYRAGKKIYNYVQKKHNTDILKPTDSQDKPQQKRKRRRKERKTNQQEAEQEQNPEQGITEKKQQTKPRGKFNPDVAKKTLDAGKGLTQGGVHSASQNKGEQPHPKDTPGGNKKTRPNQRAKTAQH